MSRLLILSEIDLERRLLRKGVLSRSDAGGCCRDCGRRPLIGETVHRFGRATVCALCRPRRRREPDATAVVHHLERGASVRPVPRAA